MNLRNTVEEIREMAANGLAYDEERSQLKLRMIRLLEMAAIGLDRDSTSAPPVPPGLEDGAIQYETEPGSPSRFLYRINGRYYRGKIRAIKAYRESHVPLPALLEAKTYVERLEWNAQEVIG
jgi:hypothetical protein